MVVAGLCIVLAVRNHASPEGVVKRWSTRAKGPVLWGKRVAFYAIVVLCLTIPSGWTQQVLEGFEARKSATSSAVTDCGDSGEERELSYS
jgi:hypothetical protein